MLKNLSPFLTGDLLLTVDSMASGDLLLLAGRDYRPPQRAGAPILDFDAEVETLAEALFSVLPLSCDDGALVCWLPEPADESTIDVAFAVNGLASDAELRRVQMVTVESEAFDELAGDAIAVIRSRWTGAACGFLLRKGDCPE